MICDYRAKEIQLTHTGPELRTAVSATLGDQEKHQSQMRLPAGVSEHV